MEHTRQVVEEFFVGEHHVMKLDGGIPNFPHTKYRIDGVVYEIIPVFDMDNCIAIKSRESFLGKTVHFE